MTLDDTQKTKLKHAYELIKAKDMMTARVLIEGVLQTHPHSVDARWMLVYTLSNPQEKRRALHKVLELKPDHQAAAQMLERLDTEFPPQHSPKQYTWRDTQIVAREHRPRRRIRWNLVILTLIGWGGAMFTFLASYDALTGANNLSFMRSSENFGYVEDTDGESIPIMKDERANVGSMVTDTLPRGEAHRYGFYGERGQELIIIVAFTTELSQPESENNIQEAFMNAASSFSMDESEGFQGQISREVQTAVIMDARDNVISRESVFNIEGAHYLQFTAPADGMYYLMLVARDGGSAGHYVMQVDTLDSLTSDVDRLLQNQ